MMNSVTGKPRGYAFIEYEKERDMHCECYVNCMHDTIIECINVARETVYSFYLVLRAT